MGRGLGWKEPMTEVGGASSWVGGAGEAGPMSGWAWLVAIGGGRGQLFGWAGPWVGRGVARDWVGGAWDGQSQ